MRRSEDSFYSAAINLSVIPDKSYGLIQDSIFYYVNIFKSSPLLLNVVLCVSNNKRKKKTQVKLALKWETWFFHIMWHPEGQKFSDANSSSYDAIASAFCCVWLHPRVGDEIPAGILSPTSTYNIFQKK